MSAEERRGYQGYSVLTPLDQQIMDLYDARHSFREIADRVDRPVLQVRKIIYTYDGTADQAKFERKTRSSTAALVAAIARHFPERIAA